MRIHALTTGTVRLKHAFLFASRGPRRQLDLFLPGPWSDPVPIHCWAVEHAGRVDRKSTRLNSSHANISYAVFCLKKKKKNILLMQEKEKTVMNLIQIEVKS